MKNLKTKVLNLFCHKKGNMAVVAAASAPLIIGAAGGAVDYSRFLDVRQSAVRALDAASLAVATGLANGEIEPEQAAQIGRDFFAANMSGFGVTADSVIDLEGAQTVGTEIAEVDGASGSGEGGAAAVAIDAFEISFDEAASAVTTQAELSVPTLFAGIFGVDAFSVPLTSTAAFAGLPGAATSVEFSFVLDVTGSMGNGGRIQALKEALTSSLNTLLPETGLNDDLVRVGFVPYSFSVNLGETYHLDAVGANRPSASSANNCVTEREGSNAFTRVAPDPDRRNTLYETDRALRPFRNGACPTVEIRPLTNDREALLDDIEALNPSGFTGGHMGIDWGINLLAEEWQDFWPEEARPADYDEEGIRKILVVMTDGAFNTAFYNSDLQNARNDQERLNLSTRQQSASRDAALEFCDLAKSEDRNIEVYTIAFLAGNAAEDLLRQCATPDDPNDPESTQHFFDAGSNNELVAAFQQIIAQELRVLLVNSSSVGAR